MKLLFKDPNNNRCCGGPLLLVQSRAQSMTANQLGASGIACKTHDLPPRCGDNRRGWILELKQSSNYVIVGCGWWGTGGSRLEARGWRLDGISFAFTGHDRYPRISFHNDNGGGLYLGYDRSEFLGDILERRDQHFRRRIASYVASSS